MLSEITKSLNAIAPHQHRYDVFRHWVTVGATAIHNQIAFDQVLEDQYLSIVKEYSREELDQFARLLALALIEINDKAQDLLGQLYMSMDLGNEHTGQFFTPYEVSKLMASLVFSKEATKATVADRGFVMLVDPACGSGSMSIAYVEHFRDAGFDVDHELFMSCTDVDPLAAMMCYIQLSALGVAAEVIIGNTLTLKYTRVMRTPRFYLNDWHSKLSQNTQN